MPKYYAYKVCGYFLYFTAKCIIEAMHVHASDSRLTEEGSANSLCETTEAASFRSVVR